MTLLVIVAIFPLIIYTDFRLKRTADNSPNIEFDYNERSSVFIIAFTPFIALFYNENFWTVFLYFIPLYAYFSILMYIANKKSWCPFSKVDIYLYMSSGLITTVLAYYIWFHEGLLTTQTVTTNSQTINALIKETDSSVWPYYVFGLLLGSILLSALLEKLSKSDKPDSSGSLLTFAVIIFPLLPLFIESYWWGMLAGLGSLLLVMPLVGSLLPGSVRGGMSFVLSYIFMMTVTLSIIIYAILF